MLSRSVRSWALEKRPKESFWGFTICDANCTGNRNSEFFEETKKALRLIRDLDSRRFSRIVAHISWIVNLESYAQAIYHPDGFCEVDFGKYHFQEYPDWSLYMYAATLVHEATHGHIYRKGIKYNNRTKLRIEKICRDEENHFLRKIESEWGDQLRKPFDPEAWRHISYWEKLRRVALRWKQTKQKAQQVAAGNVR